MQAQLELRGIATASITLLPEITRKVAPPRALAVPYPLGYPLGAPGDRALQRGLLEELLALCYRDDMPLLCEHVPP